MRKKRDEFLYIRTLAFHTHLDIIKNIDISLTIHEFRITDGVSRINVIFDLVTPFGFRYKDGELAFMIKNAIAEKDGRLNAVITVERSMC